MRPYTTPSLSTVAISAPYQVDYMQGDFNLGLSVNVVSGANTSTVEYSLDDPHAVYATDYNTNATWHEVAGLVDITANTALSMTIPCRAVRLNMSVASSGSANLTIVQAHA